MLARVFSANTSQVFFINIGHDYFQSTSTRFLQSTSTRVFSIDIGQCYVLANISQGYFISNVRQGFLSDIGQGYFFNQFRLGIFWSMLTNDVFRPTSDRFYQSASIKLYFSRYLINFFVNVCYDFLGRLWLKIVLVNVVRKDPSRCRPKKSQSTLVKKIQSTSAEKQTQPTLAKKQLRLMSTNKYSRHILTKKNLI